MTEEIRLPDITIPRRIRRVSPEDREENEERFRKKLAELTAEEEDGEGHRRSPPQSGAAGAEVVDEDEEQSGVGRNLDLRT
jgi:hypothetical protein